MAQVYAAKYLAKAAMSVPRDMVRAAVAKYRPLHPTVLIFHCTFVCDARCEMCSNWTRGNRKTDMSLAEIEHAFSSKLWKNIENASLSGGEPTTRNDMVDICRLMIDKFPKLRKLTINTTGLTPHRAIPMLTKVVEMCHERGVIFSTRVSIDGVNDMHGQVRNVKKAFEKAGKTIAAMQELQQKYRFNFGISSTIFSMNLDDADNILAWAKKEKLDIVFNMVRFTDAMLGNSELQGELKPIGLEEQRMRKFFMDRVRQDPLLDGQNYIYMHYADMIANGYHRTAPCPFQTQGVMLNPDGGMFFCELSDVVGKVTEEDPEALYFRDSAQEHRRHIRDEKCPTCLSPCQMNVAAIKQVVPYARFLVRASLEKRRESEPVPPSPPSPPRNPNGYGEVSPKQPLAAQADPPPKAPVAQLS
jgi:MoaA/NifB/PqqE/SkfB family radical SAM enzyme